MWLSGNESLYKELGPRLWCGKSIVIREGLLIPAPSVGERVTAFHTFLWGAGVVPRNNNLWSLQPQDFSSRLVWFVYAL